MIRVDKLTKRFKKKVAVKELSFEVEEGTVFALIGSNGAGKSTTIKCMLGIAGKYDGTIEMAKNARIGYSPETPFFPPYLNGKEILHYYGDLQGLHRKRLEEEITRLLTLVGLHENQTAVRHYSKGMLQRLALAQSLLGDPDVLILDEPCAGLDAAGRIEMLELIRSLKSCGKTILMNSHILSDIEKVCDEGIIMRDGSMQRAFSKSDLDEATTLEALFIETIRKGASEGSCGQ